MIEVQNLTKEFTHYKTKSGLINSLSGLFHRQKEKRIVVNQLSFNIHQGEFVGYLGPNGAGKSTTIKMLTGILVPSSGKITINGIIPHLHRIQHSQNIGVVFGQRTQLWWDLPPYETFYLLGKMYKVNDKDLKHRLEFFIDVLQLSSFLNIPVKKLSLGQRMRCELIAALLHHPQVLFLDEPTIGLDIVAKETIRSFLKKINQENKTTILLTTHDLKDVEELCKRIIIIDHGKIIHDSNLLELRNSFGNQRIAVIKLEGKNSEDLALPLFTKILKREINSIWIEFDSDKVRIPDLIYKIEQQEKIIDLSIKETEIEHVIKKIYTHN